jgi:diphthamide synthase (EF-2-diphthine--ammonia ligase)
MLEAFDLEGAYPLWQRSTRELPHEFLRAGFRSVICSANCQFFQEPVVGKSFDLQFLTSLPDEVDPNGENGEFHSFVVAGPFFKRELPVICEDRLVRHYEYEKSDGTMERVDYEFADLKLAAD